MCIDAIFASFLSFFLSSFCGSSLYLTFVHSSPMPVLSFIFYFSCYLFTINDIFTFPFRICFVSYLSEAASSLNPINFFHLQTISLPVLLPPSLSLSLSLFLSLSPLHSTAAIFVPLCPCRHSGQFVPVVHLLPWHRWNRPCPGDAPADRALATAADQLP